MTLSEPFIRRPVATSLLALALAIAGVLAFLNLAVAPLPQVAYPTIVVNAGLPGASPETMASSVATPLERQFGRIAGVTEMTSSSGLGSTTVVLQFDLGRDIDAAARDVQAAINAARAQLPANLPSNPSYRKVNPADAPAMILSLTSDSLPIPRIYDLASSMLAQEISQLDGVGQVTVGGGALPAVRVELNPNVLNKYGISLEQVRAVLAQANANTAKGQLADERTSWELHSSDQLLRASDYVPLIVAQSQGAVVHLTDVGSVIDGVQDVRAAGMLNGRPAVSMVITTEPGANIIDTVDRIRANLPRYRGLLPESVDLRVAVDRTTTIRASVHDVERTLLIAVGLVIVVVFTFLRTGWATVIPSVAVPLSLLGTFAVMWFLGYSLDNLSLMALTISTGFVVDDAIVVLENITRHLEEGRSRFDAALEGAREVGFTVLSMSLSLIAVFIPLLFMGEEYGETAPFLYFISHSDPVLVEAVRCGRQKEFAAFAGQGETPDPQAEITFQRAKLNRGLLEEPKHRLLREFYRELIHLRKTLPALSDLCKENLEVLGFEEEKVVFLRRWQEASQVFAIFNFGTGRSELHLALEKGLWSKVLDSEDPRWNVKAATPDLPSENTLPRTLLSNGTVTLALRGKALALFGLKQDPSLL